MKFFSSLSHTLKGILLIVGGVIILLNMMGITAKLFHTIVVIIGISMIIIGLCMADVHKKVYALLRKGDSKPPVEPPSPHM